MDDKTEFSPYITKLKAELLQFKIPEEPEQEDNVFLAWAESAKSLFDFTTALFDYTRSLEARLVNVEDVLLQTAMTVKDDKPFIPMKDWDKVDLTDSRFDPE